MAPNVNVEQNWTPEPELTEKPPRRIAAAEYPDLNCPNVVLFSILGGLLVLAGITLFVMGMSGHNLLYDIVGIFAALVGILALIYFSYQTRRHRMRAEHLVTYGIPVPARLLSAENLNGSVYARSVKYQITLPSGDLAHRSCNADDRTLPKRIPSNITALMDPTTGDAELYCILPYRAVSKSAPLASSLETPTAKQEASAAAMGTLSAAAPVERAPRTKPAADEKKKSPDRQSWE